MLLSELLFYSFSFLCIFGPICNIVIYFNFNMCFVNKRLLKKQQQKKESRIVKFWVQGFLGVLLKALGISLSFNFCPHSIIAVTWKCNFLEGLLRTKLAFPRYILILRFMRWEYNQKVQSYNTNRVKYKKPGEYLNCKLKLFFIQSQAPSRKTSNFPATETIRNVDYRSSSILKM